MRVKRLLVTAAATALLAACAGSPAPGCAALPGGGRYCLQPSTVLPPFNAVQTVTSEVNGHKHMLIATVEADAAGLRFAGLTPFGQKLLVAAYDNATVQVEVTPGMDHRLDPTLLLALLQLALWPEEAAAAGLAAPLQLVSEGDRRSVRDGAHTLLAIEREGAAAPFRHLLVTVPDIGLRLTVETLPMETATKVEP